MARLGFKSIRKKVAPGSTFDLSSRIEESKRLQKEQSTKLYAEMRKKYVGTFDTGLPCLCGTAFIMDHATQENPDARRRSSSDFVIGPRRDRDPLDTVEGFTVYHSYWCDKCGATYMAKVIEGYRKYVPLEATPAQKRWRSGRIKKIRDL